jgi:hypothetical protein
VGSSPKLDVQSDVAGFPVDLYVTPPASATVALFEDVTIITSKGDEA